MNKKTFLLLLALSLLAYWLIVPVRGYSFSVAESLHSLAFFVLTFWALWKYAPKIGVKKVMLPLLLPWVPELLILRVFDRSADFSLSITVLPLLAMGMALLLYYYRKVWLLLLSLALWLLLATEVKSRYVEWVAYGDMSQTNVQLSSYTVTDSVGALRLSDIQGDYLVLDVWSSTCGVCRREMPNVQALRDAYCDDARVEVASLFVFTNEKETVHDGHRIMRQLGCDIPVYGVEYDSELLDRCGIERFPRVVILDKKRDLIFNGSLEFAERKLKELTARVV